MCTVSQCSAGSRARISPVPSTWPCTMWPPSRPVTGTARSRLTGLPGASAPRLERCSVSAITSAVKASPWTSTTVRQTPLTEIESPCPASDVTAAPRTVSRAAASSSSRRTTSPSSSTIPVNTSDSFTYGTGGQPQIPVERCDVDQMQPRRPVDAAAGAACGQRGCALSQQRRCDVSDDLVDAAGVQEGTGDRRSTLQQYGPDAALV